MSTNTRKQINDLQKMRLPDLWVRFAEVVGEESRAPNKAYLIRRIRETLEAAEASPAATPKRPTRPKAPKTTKGSKSARPKKRTKTNKPSKGTGAARGTPSEATTEDTPLTKLSIADLRARYRDVVGRPTGSSNSSYLVWKIRQAQKGRIPVGPSRRTSATPGDFKVIPLRMETEVVDQIDAARERLDLPSRTALIRRALMLYLAKAGENDVAALLEKGE